MISLSIWKDAGGEDFGRRKRRWRKEKAEGRQYAGGNICKVERLERRDIPLGGEPQPSASPFSRPWLSDLSHSSAPGEERLSQTSDIARAEVFLSSSHCQYHFQARDFDWKSIKRLFLKLSLLGDGCKQANRHVIGVWTEPVTPETCLLSRSPTGHTSTLPICLRTTTLQGPIATYHSF
jgi:hypothetical protein